MALPFETPARVMKRIQDGERVGVELPSLPSLPEFEDSAAGIDSTTEESDFELSKDSFPIQSTPSAAASFATATARAPNSAVRFAASITSRSSRSNKSYTSSASRPAGARRHAQVSFDDISVISPPLDEGLTPPLDDDDSIADALEDASSRSVSPPPLPPPPVDATPRKRSYDYSVSLRAEAKPSPFDKFRNVVARKPTTLRTRTPSLSRETASPATSPSNSTPASTRSFGQPRLSTTTPLSAAMIPLPRSNTASPAVWNTPNGRNNDRPLANGRNSPSLQSLLTPSNTSSEHEDLIRSPHVGSSSELPLSVEGDRLTEPTFSSEEAPTPRLNSPATLHRASPIQPLSVAFSSPAPSVTATPTPAYSGRPQARARFNAYPVTPAGLGYGTGTNTASRYEEQDHTARGHGRVSISTEDLATPLSRRRSFLLNVINSDARPRMAFGTPHPGTIGEEPSLEEEAEHESEANDTETTPVAAPREPSPPKRTEPTPAPKISAAFADVTPRLRVGVLRSRHSQPYGRSEPLLTEKTRTPSGARPVPSAHAPEESPLERASFLSVASSNDLVTHARANASFDPVMGLAAQGHGVGRFNAGKLNAYLHNLNRQLQQENEALVDELRRTREHLANALDASGDASAILSAGGKPRRLSAGSAISRRASLGTKPLGKLEEREEENAILQDRLNELERELEARTDERDAARRSLEQARTEGDLIRKVLEENSEDMERLQRELAEEREGRATDKARNSEKIDELEKGVEGIIQELEDKAKAAASRAAQVEENSERVKRDLEHILAETEGERDRANERAERAEMALESGQDLGHNLKEANERVSQTISELRTATLRIEELEKDVDRYRRKSDTLEQDLKSSRKTIANLEADIQKKWDEVADLEDAAGAHDHLHGELMKANEFIAELEAEAGAALARIQTLESQLATTTGKLHSVEEEAEEAYGRAEELESDVKRAEELVSQVEEALKAAEKKMVTDEEKIAELKGKITSLERERDRERSLAGVNYQRDADIEGIEAELEDAHREIARLNAKLSQSPARKAMDHMKDARIELLEKEREELLERIKTLKNATYSAMNTPSKTLNMSGISPVHRHVLNMSLRLPKTPGGPLKELSWLNSTINDPTVAPLVTEIQRLQDELDRANESVDEKLDRLEDAGQGVVDLTAKLEDARAKITALEEELSRLSRRDERRQRRLEKARCLKCHSKVDVRSLDRVVDLDESSLDISTDLADFNSQPTKSSEMLRSELRDVNTQLQSMKVQWEKEKRQLLGEKAALQDTANRLSTKVRDSEAKAAKAEAAAQKARSSADDELEKAKAAIAEFEDELKAERSRLRALTAEKGKAEREKKDVLLQLQRTEADMEDVKHHLQSVKQENHDLEKELRANSNAEQKARLLEVKVAENAEAIEQLREERSILASNHHDLQQRFAQASENVAKLRERQSASQTSHDNRRHQLDLHQAEIEELRRSLTTRAGELEQTAAERARLAAKQSDVTRTVAQLEADLARVKREALAFGRDLKVLRAEKERAEEEERKRAEEARRAGIREREAREEVLRVAKRMERHVCATDNHQVAALKIKHTKECQGLMVQIKYLQAKFTRESEIRRDLGFQKYYLLRVLSNINKSDTRIIALIATIEFPLARPAKVEKRRRTLRQAVFSIMFIERARRTADEWREQCKNRPALTAALEEVHRQRAIAAEAF